MVLWQKLKYPHASLNRFGKLDWAGLGWQYLFFWYFSGIVNLVILASGKAGFVGTRSALVFSALWLIPTLLFPQRAKLISALIGLLLLPFSLLGLAYLSIYHQEFSQSVLFIVFESNTSETAEYLSNYFSWWIVGELLLYCVGAYLLWKRVRPVHVSKPSALIFSIVLLFALFVSPFMEHMLFKQRSYEDARDRFEARIEPTVPWQVVIGYAGYRRQLDNMQQLLKKNADIAPLHHLKDAMATKPATLVLVIGESTNRQRMSLYGYGRDTTPNLNKMKDDLLVFQDVVASRPYTIEVLEQALTFADQMHPDLYLTQPTMMNMMKQAGYKTFWITNQQTMTKRNTMLTTFSQQTDVQYYLNNNRSQDTRQYDNTVFQPFMQVLHDPAPRKFIVVHLLGTHMNYKYRYPQSYAKFKDRSGVPGWVNNGDELDFYNSYDNAVLYNDFVVSSLINQFSDAKANGLLLYMSDHGEEVYDTPGLHFKGRSEGSPLPTMYTIPFIMWQSKTWKENHPAQYQNALNRPYSSSGLIHTWADLAGLTFDGFNPTKSLVNNTFKEYPRLIGNPYVKRQLVDFASIAVNAKLKVGTLNKSKTPAT